MPIIGGVPVVAIAVLCDTAAVYDVVAVQVMISSDVVDVLYAETILGNVLDSVVTDQVFSLYRCQQMIVC